MKILAIANQKGGVGKTAISVHLAFYFAEKGKRVLFIDLDPQCNSSSTLREFRSDISSSSLFQSDCPTLPPASADLTLIAGDKQLIDLERAEKSVIQTFVMNLESVKGYDLCIMDTGPTMGFRMTAALIASDYVLTPIEVEQYSIDGTKDMINTIAGTARIREKTGRGFSYLGILPNRVNNTSPMHISNLKALIKNHPKLVIPKKISTRTSIGEALHERVPVWKLKKSAAKEAGKEMRDVFDYLESKMDLGASK